MSGYDYTEPVTVRREDPSSGGATTELKCTLEEAVRMIAAEQKGTITRLSSVIIREHAAPIQEIEEINAIYSRSDFRK